MIEAARLLKDDLQTIRRRLHRQPELSFEEHNTTRLIKEALDVPGLEPLDLGLATGAVFLLQGAKPGKTVVLRADIDAIAVEEAPGLSPRSQVPGVAHACGHDIHTACAIGAARLLLPLRERLAGNVALLFQPAEEVTQGARTLLDHGLLEALPAKPAAFFGLHCSPAPVGTVGLCGGPAMAGKTNFRLTLAGQSGHAGLPHQYVDAIPAAAALIQAVQTIVSRNTDPLKALVCAVHTVNTDAPGFFVSERVMMTGSIRALDDAVLEDAQTRLRHLAEQTAQTYGCACHLELLPQVPALVNAPALEPLARKAAALAAGSAGVQPAAPNLLSEDFALYSRLAPAWFYWLGCLAPGASPQPLHAAGFCASDDALPIGAVLLAQSALLALDAG